MAPACGVPDPYQVLGVCETAPTEEIIREAWRKKALEAHPDKGGSEQAFNEVQAAYEWLKALHQCSPARSSEKTKGD